NRAGGARAENGTTRYRGTGSAHAESENSAWPVARFHRAARPFAPSGNDAGRRTISSGKTIEAAARPTNDAYAASGASRWPQFLAGFKRAAANFSTVVRKPGRCRRGQRSATADSAQVSQTFDAGERTA